MQSLEQFFRSGKSWPGLMTWSLAWTLMVALDGQLSMPNLTLLLILGSAVAGLWLGPFFSTLINVASVALFSFLFVEPRFDFWPSLEDDLMLLITTLVVSSLVSILTARLRSAVAQQALQTERVTRLRRLSDSFVESDDVGRHMENLLQAIRDMAHAPVSGVLLVRQNDHQEVNSHCFFGKPRGRVRRELVRVVESPPETWYGPHERPGLLSIRICPKSRVLGAVCIDGSYSAHLAALGLDYLQELCDLVGVEFERAEAVRIANRAMEKAQSQTLRNTLLTAISHDYRTPLATIIGSASALVTHSEHYSPDRIPSIASTIIGEAEHLNRITTNTLQLARLGGDNLSLHMNWESLEEIAGAAAGRLLSTYPGALVELAFPQELPLLYCDAILILQMIDNLLMNAIKYSAEGTRITIDARTERNDVLLRVSDCGPGVPVQWREKVFDAFQRLEIPGQPPDSGMQDQDRRGVGLGLAVCRTIVRAHQGRIWIEDSDDGGARVCVTFPLAEVPPAPLNDPEDVV